MITLDLQSRKPIYEQLKEKIINLTMLEVFTPDQQLPSVRSLARDLGVNPNTVQKAYQELEREGIIYSVSGKGSFISSDIGTKTLLFDQQRKKLFDVISESKQIGVDRQTVIEITDQVYREGEEKAND